MIRSGSSASAFCRRSTDLVHHHLGSELRLLLQAIQLHPDLRSRSGSVSEETGQDAFDQFRVAVSVDMGRRWCGEQLAEPWVLA